MIVIFDKGSQKQVNVKQMLSEFTTTQNLRIKTLSHAPVYMYGYTLSSVHIISTGPNHRTPPHIQVFDPSTATQGCHNILLLSVITVLTSGCRWLLLKAVRWVARLMSKPTDYRDEVTLSSGGALTMSYHLCGKTRRTDGVKKGEKACR